MPYTMSADGVAQTRHRIAVCPLLAPTFHLLFDRFWRWFDHYASYSDQELKREIKELEARNSQLRESIAAEKLKTSGTCLAFTSRHQTSRIFLFCLSLSLTCWL